MWARLEFPRETGLILRCAGKAGNPFQTMRGNRLSCRDQDEMVGWHHQLDGHESEQALGVGDGQGSGVLQLQSIGRPRTPGAVVEVGNQAEGAH